MATVRLRSRRDPSVIIEGPVGAPFDPREWEPDAEVRTPPKPVEAPPEDPAAARRAAIEQAFATAANPSAAPALDVVEPVSSDPAIITELATLQGPNIAPTAGGLAARLIGPKVG